MTSPRSTPDAPRALRPRRRAALSLTAAALLVLTACGRDEPAPEAAPSSASATQQLAPMDMAPFTLDAPSHDLALVPGASLAVIQGRAPEYHAAWLQVPGAPAWSEDMSRSVRDHVGQYTRDTDTTADPVLDVQPRLSVVGADIGAVRLLSTERRGDQSVSAARVAWYSAREDRVLSTADLFTDAGWDDFRSEVGDRMKSDPAVVRERLDSAVQHPDQVENGRVWDALVLLPDGSVLLEMDQAALAPADAGVLTARIPADTVQSWLSDLGRSAQDAARSPKAMRLPERATAAPDSPTATGAPAPAPAAPRSSTPRSTGDRSASSTAPGEAPPSDTPSSTGSGSGDGRGSSPTSGSGAGSGSSPTSGSSSTSGGGASSSSSGRTSTPPTSTRPSTGSGTTPAPGSSAPTATRPSTPAPSPSTPSTSTAPPSPTPTDPTTPTGPGTSAPSSGGESTAATT